MTLLIDKLRTYALAIERRDRELRAAADKAMVELTVAELNLGIARFNMTGELQTFVHGQHMLNCLPSRLLFDALNGVDVVRARDILSKLNPRSKRR